MNVDEINELIKNSDIDTDKISDGYHEFEELYEFRLLYNANLFNEWYNVNKYNVEKSKRHSDGTECFGGGWFIVTAMLPGGLISNHYEIKHWDLFQIQETPQSSYEYDGHTAGDVIDRLKGTIPPLNPSKKVMREIWSKNKLIDTQYFTRDFMCRDNGQPTEEEIAFLVYDYAIFHFTIRDDFDKFLFYSYDEKSSWEGNKINRSLFLTAHRDGSYNVNS